MIGYRIAHNTIRPTEYIEFPNLKMKLRVNCVNKKAHILMGIIILGHLKINGSYNSWKFAVFLVFLYKKITGTKLWANYALK